MRRIIAITANIFIGILICSCRDGGEYPEKELKRLLNADSIQSALCQGNTGTGQKHKFWCTVKYTAANIEDEKAVFVVHDLDSDTWSLAQ